jgi:mRNA interferase YafQ
LKFKIKYGSRFKRDLEKIKHQPKAIEIFKFVVLELSEGNKLDAKFKDHKLKGEYKDYRECHLMPDLLLIYKYDNDYLVLYRLGSHSDLFN